MGLIKRLIKKIRGKERRKSLSKRLSLVLACLLSFNLFPGSIKANAAETKGHKITVNGMSPEEYNTVYENYLNGIEAYATGSTGIGVEIIPGIIAPPITIDGEVAYCLNLRARFPEGNGYPDGNPYDNNNIKAVLYHGYPVDSSGLQRKYGISNREARYYTQVAIWQMTGDLTSRNYGIGYVDELLELGRRASIPNVVFNISPNNLEATQMNGYQETGVIATSGSSGTFTFPSDSNIWSVDINGNKKNIFNVGESFKIRSTKGYNGSKIFSVGTKLNKPAALKYDGSAGFQDIVKYYSDPIAGQFPLRVKFTGTGKIEVIKKDDLGNLLPGVKFGLFTDSKATNKISEAITGKDGKLVFNNVVARDYWIKELETLPTHVLNPEIKKVTVNGGDTQKVEYTNEIIKGKIKVTKVDEETGAKLQGAEFEVKDKATGKVVDKLVTGADGTAISKLLPYGEYIVKEIKAPNKYTLNGKEYVVTVNKHMQTLEITHQNKIIKGKIKVTKVDEETGEKLQGAEFEIKDKATGEVVDKLVTGTDGTATSKLLPYGEYIVKETKAPNKYTLNRKEYFVTINKDLQTIELTHQNKIIKGRVEIVKEDSEIPGLKIPGVKFGIFDTEGNQVEELTTDENGYAISGWLKYGDYKLRELNPANGYLPATQEWDIQIREDQKVYKYNIKNDVIKGSIQVVKVDKVTNKPVKGVKFGVYAKNVFGIEPNTLVEEITTDENGFAYTSKLRFGEYYLKESEAPQDYYPSDTEYPVNITENNKVYVEYISNEPVQMKLRVLKYDADSETKEAIKGAKFKVVNRETGEDVVFTEFFGIIPIKKTVFTTNKNGEIVFPQVLKYGNYDLVEVEPAEGFNLIEPISFTIDRNTNSEEIELLGKVHTIEVGNTRIKGNLKILKVDEETKEALEGVKFKITCTEGFMKGQEWTEVTDENGEINLKDLEYGKYVAEEIEGLWNYVENNNPIKFEVTENGKTIELEVTNKKIRGSVELLKVDSETGRPLEGAEFELWNGEKLVGIFTTDENGKIVVEDLEAGNYYWVEVKAPEHYKINQDVSLDFVIYEDNQKVEITVENEVKTGEVDFSKTDVTTGENIEGAKIEIVGIEEHNKHIKIEFTSSIDGNKFTLPEGDYEFRETLAPNGFVQTTEVGKFSIKDGEITKAELKNERIKGTVDFTKVDAKTGEALDGAKIKIECLEGFNKGEVIEFVSSKDGNKFELEYGKYKISETMPPEGYELTTETVEFEITEDGQVIKAELKNKKIPEAPVLPYTGGTNTTIVLGIALVITLTGVIMLKKKKATN